MNGTFKNLVLTTTLLSISASAHAFMDTRSVLKTINDPSAKAEDRCSVISNVLPASNEQIARNLADLINDPDPEVQACAIRAAGVSRNEFAADALLANVQRFQAETRSRGLYEVNLKARIKAIDSIWSLGEIANPKSTEKLLKFFADSDNVVKVNIAVSAGKTKAEFSKKFLYALAGNTSESSVVRAAAYEMLEENKAPAPAPGVSLADGIEKGDIIYTGGIFGIPQNWIGDMPVGHAGIFGGTEVRDGKLVVVIYDCVPDFFKPYGGVRKVYAWKYFTHENSYPFYGNRVSKVRPTKAQRELIIKAAIAKLGHHYSDTHLSQKGPEDYDCVGYTEYAYEAAGLNPTPDDQETGWGWPLTPAEQYAATVANTQMKPPLMIAGNADIKSTQQEIINKDVTGLLKSYGIKIQASEVPANIRFEPVN